MHQVPCLSPAEVLPVVGPANENRGSLVKVKIVNALTGAETELSCKNDLTTWTCGSAEGLTKRCFGP